MKEIEICEMAEGLFDSFASPGLKSFEQKEQKVSGMISRPLTAIAHAEQSAQCWIGCEEI